jgi:hypothetical protein
MVPRTTSWATLSRPSGTKSGEWWVLAHALKPRPFKNRSKKENGWRNRQPFPVGRSQSLPVSTATAAVGPATAATAVESAATTAEPSAAVVATAHVTSTVESTVAACERMSAACVTSSSVVEAITGASVSNATAVAYSTAIACSAVVPTATVVATAAIVSATSPIAVIPGAGADEDPSDKPARAIVAIGRARVGIIVVVPPRTHWGRVSVAIIPVPRIPVPWTNANSYTDLGISGSRHKRYWNHYGAEQQEIS